MNIFGDEKETLSWFLKNTWYSNLKINLPKIKDPPKKWMILHLLSLQLLEYLNGQFFKGVAPKVVKPVCFKFFPCQRELCRTKKASHSPKNHLVGKRCASLENSDSAFDVRHYQQFSVIFTRREYDLTLQDLSFSSFHCQPLLSSDHGNSLSYIRYRCFSQLSRSSRRWYHFKMHCQWTQPIQCGIWNLSSKSFAED